MEKYSIKQAAKKLNCSADTLRYYDKLAIVMPKRGENGYRYYTSDDLHILKYLHVMKYADFSLSEIKRVLSNIETQANEKRLDTIELLKNKHTETIRKIETYKRVASLLEMSIHISSRPDACESADIDILVDQVFNEINNQTEDSHG